MKGLLIDLWNSAGHFCWVFLHALYARRAPFRSIVSGAAGSAAAIFRCYRMLRSDEDPGPVLGWCYDANSATDGAFLLAVR